MTNQPKKNMTSSKPAESRSKSSHTYLLSLEIENVLCFKDKQFLKLSDENGNYAKWTVILGNNGVGKTTLLRCLAMLEKGEEDFVNHQNPFPAFVSTGIMFRMLGNDLIWEDLETLHTASATINAEIVSLSCIKKSLTITDEHQESQKAQIKISLGVSSSNFGIHPENIKEAIAKICSVEEYKTYLEQNNNDKLFMVEMGISKNFLDNLNFYGYGATRKNGKELLSKTTFPKNSISIFSDDATLINAEEWLLQTDYAIKSSSGKTKDHLQKQFDRITEILKRILPDITDIRIAPPVEERPMPRAEFRTPYGWVRLSSLGLGYRTTIAWMVDLAVRLFKRYPDSEDPLAEPAIVLVDEIDLHMHPTWQRTIMEFLTERFPNTQFIVTAHSPLVVQAAQNANIVLLRREGDRVIIDNNPEIIENWRVDQVLTSVFEIPSARPPQIEKLLAERQEILTKPKLSKADKAKLKELESKIGTLPTAENPEDIRAMDIIRRAAKLLEKPVTEAVE